MSTNNDNLSHKEHALQYLSIGWNVIPLGIKSKIPNGDALISTGHKHTDEKGKVKGSWDSFKKTERVTEDLIERWRKHTPRSNLGIITGKTNKIIVVDIDPRNGGDVSMKNLHLPPTYMVNTGGGGWHYYYSWNFSRPAPALDYLDGIEIKGDGGYVVAPPSIHDKTSLPYEAVNSIDEMIEAPEWLCELKPKSERKEKLWEVGAEGVDVGKRNKTAASVVGKTLKSLHKKLHETIGWNGIKGWNQANKKPLDEKELRTVFDSIKDRSDSNDKTETPVPKKIVKMVLNEKPISFHDHLNTSFVSIRINDHQEIYPMMSQQFKQWIVRKYWEQNKQTLNTEHVKQAIDLLISIAIHEGEEKKLENRVAGTDNAIWYDLCNKDWSAIKISSSGWEFATNPPIIFRRYKHQKPQTTPIAGGSLSQLLQFVNIADESQRLLFLVYLISCFVPNIPHPIPILYGSQGSAKSTFMRVIRRLIDPSSLELLSFPTRKEELVQQLSHHWTPFYDNVTTMPEWLSDALCRAVTGEGFSKRELYTNDEDMIYSFRCCIGINGINIAGTKADLLDRALLFGLERIKSENRKDEQTFWKQFEENCPLILGAIFEALSRAITIRPTVKVKELPRMADFTLWGCAISEAIGSTQDAFLVAYRTNIGRQNDEAIQEHPVASAIVAFMQDQNKWAGTSTELLYLLEDLAISEKINIKQSTWPKTPQLLTRRLNEVKTNLETIGINIRSGTFQHKRMIEITRPINTVDTVVPNNTGNDDDDESGNKIPTLSNLKTDEELLNEIGL